MYNSYVIPIVDGAAMKRQAWARLTDSRGLKEETLVHNHGYEKGVFYDSDKSRCNEKCLIYHFCDTDGKPHSHSRMAETCPDWKEEEDG